MKIYFLERIDECQYEEHIEKVVMARSETRAREIANANCGIEGKIWHDLEKVSCKKVPLKIEHEILAAWK
jgi:hypothetical protein